jgi:predicted MPP superfamily phosphohydrolase
MKPDIPAVPARSRSPMKAFLTRRRLLAGAGGLLGSSALGTAAYAGGIEAQSLTVTRYTPEPAAWPGGQRLSITVIADIHAGGPNMTASHVRRIVDTANDLKSDIVVLLGDYIATYRFVNVRMPHRIWAAELARLTAPLGVWAVLGNHDWWHDVAAIRTSITAIGIPVLENDAVLLGPEGARFWLAGLGDQRAFRLGHGRFRGVDDLPRTLSQIRSDDPILLLAHEPDIFARLPSRIALTLAGHTHGGQIRLPLIWPAFVPSKYGARYAYGHVVEDGRHMIVSGGLGTSFIPARLGVPPEVVQVVLGA